MDFGVDTINALAVIIDQIVLQVISQIAHAILIDSYGASHFAVQASECDPCPASQFTLIGAAWANIGYMTHADFLNFVNFTKFGTWALLLYAAAAISGLVGVAIGMPPRTYVWFMLGPAIYSFLISTTQDVKGVAWVVANRQQEMKEVWRDAEVGMSNTTLVKRLGITVNKEQGPSGTYHVATAMLFLDELFSATTNLMISWIGIYNQRGTGANNTNLAAPEGEAEGPWYLLSTLKWPLIENLTSISVRNPDVRDALITFLASECGDKFKQGVSSGAYIAAASSKAASLPYFIFLDDGVVGPPQQDPKNPGLLQLPQYRRFTQGLDATSMPTPRSMIRLFNDQEGDGPFGKFMEMFGVDGGGEPKPIQAGRGVEIVCSEYLYTIIQALRWETGHSYWQLVRSSPNGLTRNQFLKTLFYGWDIRSSKQAQYATNEEMTAFVKQLMLVYLIRNELLYAPQLTTFDQRFAPAQQSRGYTEAYVRSYGSKGKWGELYNWAVLMPHIQGILVYLLLIAYPFAAMVMVIPGYWKAFFTWVAFFAWVKLWDVGFAIVQILERSVWAMIGNHSSMARVANMLIQNAQQAGSIGVTCAAEGYNADDNKQLSELCAIPRVCSADGLDGSKCQGTGGPDQETNKAWSVLEKAMILSARADLDLANGYYIYIMAALYFAVPAVAGQLVLGAKAGAASMVGGMMNGVSAEAGRMAATGAQHQDVNRLMANQASLSQASLGKHHRQNGLVNQQLGLANQGMDAGVDKSFLDNASAGWNAGAEGLGRRAKSFEQGMGGVISGAKVVQGLIGFGGNGAKASGAGTGAGTGGLLGGGVGFIKWAMNQGGQVARGGMEIAGYGLNRDALAAQVRASGRQMDNSWNAAAISARQSGLSGYADRLAHEANFAAETGVWEDRNAFGAHASSQGGIAGMNSGSLAPGAKPTDATGMAMTGMLGRGTEQAARYVGTGFITNAAGRMAAGRQTLGSSWVYENWGGGFSRWGAFDKGMGVLRPYGKQIASVWNDSPLSNIRHMGNPVDYLQQGVEGGANIFRIGPKDVKR